jgi:ketosteroid isomerase-like protein
MKRSALVLFVILLAMVLTGCLRASTDTNKNDAVATASPVKERFDPAAIQAEILKLEREWMDAPKTKNGDAVRRVVADDAVLVYPDGTVATKADEVRTIEAGDVTSDSFEMIDPKVTVISADAAILAGRSTIKNGKYRDPNTKKTIDISGEYRFLEVYAKRDGKWQVIASQATKVVAPPK